MEALVSIIVILVIVLFFVLILASASIKVLQEYERGVMFRLGRLVGAKGPGIIFLIPVVDRIQRVDLRVITLEIPPQEVISKDNVTLKVDAVAYFRIVEPNDAIVKVGDFMRATLQIAQTTLRSVLGQSDLDELLARREKVNERLQQIIDQQTEPWGIKVSIVEVKDVELPQTMQRAMARQAEAEREKRAKVIHAEGEFLAAQTLSSAAQVIERIPTTLQLRYLQTLTEIATEKNSTILFPFPLDIISPFLKQEVSHLIDSVKERAVSEDQQSSEPQAPTEGSETTPTP